jgi:hypothetical protein
MEKIKMFVFIGVLHSPPLQKFRLRNLRAFKIKDETIVFEKGLAKRIKHVKSFAVQSLRKVKIALNMSNRHKQSYIQPKLPPLWST